MPIEAVKSTKVYRKLDRKLRRKTIRRRIIRYGILGFNLLLLTGVLSFVLIGQRSANVNSGSQKAVAAAQTDSKAVNPLDQVSSADVAYSVATMGALAEISSVAAQAASVNIELSSPPATASIVSKPQVVSTALKSKRDIKPYTAVPGDTVVSIAAKFNVTSDSVRWSNNLTANAVTAGTVLYLPPEGVNGIVYVVKAGDTPDSLATKYRASKEEIILYNDAEITPLKVGERIIIPNGSIQAPAARTTWSGLAWGDSPIYGSNGYDYGYCTWYVANRISVPANWGNANTWDNGALRSGWIVSQIPRVGAIAQDNGGYFGHVAYVEAVSPDGTMIKYSDMNGLAGWGRVGYSDWVPALQRFDNFIYR